MIVLRNCSDDRNDVSDAVTMSKWSQNGKNDVETIKDVLEMMCERSKRSQNCQNDDKMITKQTAMIPQRSFDDPSHMVLLLSPKAYKKGFLAAPPSISGRKGGLFCRHMFNYNILTVYQEIFTACQTIFTNFTINPQLVKINYKWNFHTHTSWLVSNSELITPKKGRQCILFPLQS